MFCHPWWDQSPRNHATFPLFFNVVTCCPRGLCMARPHGRGCPSRASSIVIFSGSWKSLHSSPTGGPSAWGPDFCVSAESGMGTREIHLTLSHLTSWVESSISWLVSVSMICWHVFRASGVMLCGRLTVHGPCIHGSPSICIGKVFFVVSTTSLHWANLRPEALSPVLTWPMCRQFSNPITSIRRSPKSEIHTGKEEKKIQISVPIRAIIIMG